MTFAMHVSRAAVLFLVILGLAAPAGAQDAADPPAEPTADAAAPTVAVAPASEADRLVLNALAGTTADSLTGFRDRPLFTPSRQPPAPPVAEAPPPEPEPEPQPQPEPEPEVTPPNVRLAGTLNGDGAAIAMIQDLGTGETKPYKSGETIEDWTVDAIEATTVRLTYEGRTFDLKLFQPGATSPLQPGAGDAVQPDGIDPSDVNPQQMQDIQGVMHGNGPRPFGRPARDGHPPRNGPAVTGEMTAPAAGSVDFPTDFNEPSDDGGPVPNDGSAADDDSSTGTDGIPGPSTDPSAGGGDGSQDVGLDGAGGTDGGVDTFPINEPQ